MQALFDVIIDTLNSLVAIFAGVANLAGIALVIYGLVGLTRGRGNWPQQRNSTSAATTSLIVGSILIVAFKALDITSATFFNQSSRQLLDHTLLPGSEISAQIRYMVGSVYAVIATVGFYAFVRGWLILREEQRSNRVSRAATYIIAGVLAINLDLVMRITAGTVAQFSAELASNIRLFTP